MYSLRSCSASDEGDLGRVPGQERPAACPAEFAAADDGQPGSPAHSSAFRLPRGRVVGRSSSRSGPAAARPACGTWPRWAMTTDVGPSTGGPVGQPDQVTGRRPPRSTLPPAGTTNSAPKLAGLQAWPVRPVRPLICRTGSRGSSSIRDGRAGLAAGGPCTSSTMVRRPSDAPYTAADIPARAGPRPRAGPQRAGEAVGAGNPAAAARLGIAGIAQHPPVQDHDRGVPAVPRPEPREQRLGGGIAVQIQPPVRPAGCGPRRSRTRRGVRGSTGSR